jgi:hypothetical protein
VLHPELSAVLGAERFLAEIKLTAALQHPHILPLFDSGAADGLLFYVMPFVDGETLRTRLAREKQLPVDDAVRLAQQVASALEAAHRRGVIHRDIEPENILLQDDNALVADFGIALAVQHAGGQRMTQTGLSLGTPQYMSPEQAMGEREITARSDVYALGAVTYEMLAGEPPFAGPTVQAIIARVITEEPRSLVAQRRSVPAHGDVAVRRALEKLPADRFGTAAGFAAALDGGGASPVSSASASAPARRERSHVARLAPWAAAVVALLAGLAAGRRHAPPLGLLPRRAGRARAREPGGLQDLPGNACPHADRGWCAARDGGQRARRGLGARRQGPGDHPDGGREGPARVSGGHGAGGVGGLAQRSTLLA